jgi:hypothetical protein
MMGKPHPNPPRKGGLNDKKLKAIKKYPLMNTQYSITKICSIVAVFNHPSFGGAGGRLSYV